jgi:hypothetical protein
MVEIKESEIIDGLKYINNELANGVYVDDGGDMYWYKDGKRHRDGDQPAMIYNNSGKLWFQNGRIHRDGDQPAVTHIDGYKAWYKIGIRQRDGDKPALIYGNGSKEWYRNGERYYPNKE